MGAVPIALGKRVGAVPATIGLLVAWIVAYGLTHMWKNTFGLLFEWLGTKEIAIPLPKLPDVSIHPLGFLRTINRKVFNWLSDVTAVSERGFVYCLNLAVEPYLLIIGTVVALGLVTFEGIRALQHTIAHTLPQTIETTIVRPVTRKVTVTAALTKAQLARFTGQVDALQARVRAIAATIPHAIPNVIPRVGRLERDGERLWGRVRRLDKVTAGAGAAALVAAALAKLGLGWIRCGKMRRAGKAACAMDTDFLEGLLAGALLVVGAVSLRELADDVGAIMEPVADGVERFIREA